MVGGVGSPIGRQSGSLNLRKTMFYCGKMEMFDVVHFMFDVFQLRIKNFSSVEVEVVDGPWQLFFVCVLFSPLELRGAHLVIYQRSLEKGIMYCVSTGILMWCCFSLGILSVFAYHQNFPVLWVSSFFLFQPSHGASLITNVGWRQLLIASCRKRASAFTTLSKPGFLFR